ncbi:CBS domain-containing protein [Candidatus Nitrosotalea bavarica]|uniref:CBS domain-containing protein n=1 Tax=Candidatus Nitrosotalea bavarica TaxID=1903277 RepID=UPI000C705EFD|nr:CBS domain-containing protein [Candidatus Nitrosotalea bavarica]
MNILRDKSLEEVLPESIFSTPVVSIRVEDTLGEAATLLPHHLETLTDSLVVTSNDKPVGIVGGIEVLEGILENQTSEFLDKTKIGDVMSKNLVIMNSKNKFSELVNQWLETRRAFAIIPNQYKGYSVISARKILEVGTSFKINTTVSAIPTKKIITFHKNDTVRQIIQRMFEYDTRKLVLEGTSFYINDRIIIQKLVREFNCLRDEQDFLGMKSDIFSLEEAKNVPGNITITEACKIMQDMKSPYLRINDKVISPWDMVLILNSDNLS